MVLLSVAIFSIFVSSLYETGSMRTWLIVLLVATVALLAVVVEAGPQFEEDDRAPSRVFKFIKRIFRRRFDDADGDEDGERGGILGFILRLLNNLVDDDDDSDVEITDTDTDTDIGASERMRLMVRGRKGMRGFLHTFLGTLANYGFGKSTAAGGKNTGSIGYKSLLLILPRTCQEERTINYTWTNNLS